MKNENETLPLQKNLRSVAVIGALGDSAEAALGTWAAAGRGADVVTILDAFRYRSAG
ncbi:MAG: glycoside hydrolase family 3 C-terminal domain-containing protein [Gemmatimonadota bacterium]